MKKIYIALAVAAAALLTSCVKEQSFEQLTPLGENAIAFTIKNAATRSMDKVSDSSLQTGVTISAGKTTGGEPIFLEESIQDLNPTPITKGAPAYTENVGTLYNSLGVYADGFGDEAFELMDDHMTENPNGGQGWRYAHHYAGSPWPDADTKVDFYLNMPANASGVDFKSREDKVTVFDYESPTTGVAQQDILFAQTSLSMSEHDGYLPYGAPVMMYHALTGIKFRNGHENDNPTKTIITKVTIKGLKSTGTCTFDPSADNIIEWERLDNSTTFSQSFTNQAWEATAGVDGTVTFTPDDAAFGQTWYSDSLSNTHNLNAEDGSLTFWFIPQEIDESVTMEVTFRIKTKDTQDGTEITHVINFGEQLNKERENNVEWKAGQLRTYTVKPRDVDVKIVDSMVGLKKSDLHVTNTGNVDEFVRIMVIGNWYGWETQADMDANKEPDIMVGYTTDGSTGDNTMVTPWFREDAVYGQYFDDTFPMGRPAAGRTDWVRGTGSYFYFTEKIGAGVTLDSATQALFQSYELPADKIPTIYIPVSTSNVRVPAVGVHLKMEIVVQAIGTTDANGDEYEDQGDRKAWMLAWSDAVGKTVTIKN